MFSRPCHAPPLKRKDRSGFLQRHCWKYYWNTSKRGSWALRPLLALARLPTVGLLPPAIRDAYGFEWTARQERRLAMLSAVVRHALPRASPVLRHWPAARRAETRGAG